MSINVKEGLQVKTKEDLQELVTSIIFRQINSFSQEEIVKQVLKKLNVSPLWKFSEEELLEEIVESTITTLLHSGTILREKEKYRIRRIILI